MKKVLVILMMLVASVASAVEPLSVAQEGGKWADAKSKFIGYNEGVGQVIISSAAAKYMLNKVIIKNWSDGYNLFIDTSVVISTAVVTGVSQANGYMSTGYLLEPGESVIIDERNDSPIYGLCPVSSTTISLFELRKEPAGKSEDLLP